MADDSLDAALARAQTAMTHPKKTKVNPHFKSDYADLADVLNAVRPALNAEGIAVVQTVEAGELVTELRRNGETIRSSIPLNLDVKPQELGSQLSYLRRYALSAIAGVASESDDDGNAAAAAPKRTQTRTATPEPPPRPNSGSNPRVEVTALLSEFQRLCDALGIEGAKDKAGFVAATVGRDAKWSALTLEEANTVIGDLTAIAGGENQLVYDNAGRPQAAPLGDAFLETSAS
jgi:hypothetical protein